MNQKNIISVIRREIFQLKPLTFDPTFKRNREVLKDFIIQIVTPEDERIQRAELKFINHISTKAFYKPELTDYENQLNYEKHKSTQNIDDLDPDEIIYAKNYISKSNGCVHQVRHCEKQCFTCKKFYPCRICHDDNEDHEFPRNQTEFFKCNNCNKLSKCGLKCKYCKQQFGNYYCDICKYITTINDESRPIYHCNDCESCVIGIQAQNKHCFKCNNCFLITKFDQHLCESNNETCNVCLDVIKQGIQLQCGHTLHDSCYDQLLVQGIYKCPICRKFLPVQRDSEAFIELFKQMYKRKFLFYPLKVVKVQCNDCLNQFSAYEHPQLYFCQNCENFNCDVIEFEGDVNEAEKLYQTSKQKPLTVSKKDAIRYLQTLIFNKKIQNSGKLLEIIGNNSESYVKIARIANLYDFRKVQNFLDCFLEQNNDDEQVNEV